MSLSISVTTILPTVFNTGPFTSIEIVTSILFALLSLPYSLSSLPLQSHHRIFTMLIVLRTTIWVTFTNKLNLPPSLSGYAGDQFMESTLIPLAVTTTPTIEDCDLLCDANSACISFETSGSTCQLSSSCDHSMTTDSNGWNYYVRVQEGVVAPLEGNSFFGCLIMQQKSPPLNWHKLAQFNWLLRHTTLDIPMVVVLG